MLGVDKSSPYRKALITLINSIDRVIPMKPENQVLIVLRLDTEEKIVQFNNWVKSRLTGENELNATEVEIAGAASLIGKGRNPAA